MSIVIFFLYVEILFQFVSLLYILKVYIAFNWLRVSALGLAAVGTETCLDKTYYRYNFEDYAWAWYSKQHQIRIMKWVNAASLCK